MDLDGNSRSRDDGSVCAVLLKVIDILRVETLGPATVSSRIDSAGRKGDSPMRSSQSPGSPATRSKHLLVHEIP